jgi:hypothetical protein
VKRGHNHLSPLPTQTHFLYLGEEPVWVDWVKKINKKSVVQDRLLAVGIYRIFSIKRTKTGKKQVFPFLFLSTIFLPWKFHTNIFHKNWFSYLFFLLFRTLIKLFFIQIKRAGHILGLKEIYSDDIDRVCFLLNFYHFSQIRPIVSRQ